MKTEKVKKCERCLVERIIYEDGLCLECSQYVTYKKSEKAKHKYDEKHLK